jgi:hypothetical protein
MRRSCRGLRISRSCLVKVGGVREAHRTALHDNEGIPFMHYGAVTANLTDMSNTFASQRLGDRASSPYNGHSFAEGSKGCST